MGPSFDFNDFEMDLPEDKSAAVVAKQSTDSLTIEQNVPITKKYTGPKKLKWPFEKLEIGNSFFVTDDMTKKSAPKAMVSACANAMRKYSVDNVRTREFICRTVDGGARVWRIK